MKEKQPKYFKVKRGDNVYYYQDQLQDKVQEALDTFDKHRFSIMLMALADFCVNIRTNQVLKCRYMAKEILDDFTGLGEFKLYELE